MRESNWAQGGSGRPPEQALSFEIRHVQEMPPSTPASTHGDAEAASVTSSIDPTEASCAGASAEGDPIAEFGVSPFYTKCGPLRALGGRSADLDFSLHAPTTSKNLFRVLRAMQVRKRERGGGQGERSQSVTLGASDA